MFFGLLVVQRLISVLSGVAADAFVYDAIDPYGLFAWISVHHIVQLAAGMALVLILAKLLRRDFGLTPGERKAGFKAVALFSAGFCVYTVVAFGITWIAGNGPAIDFPLNAQNVGGTLVFQLLLSGPSEEVLFRALPVTMLAIVNERSIVVKAGKFHISLECVLAALLFSFAHVRIDLLTFVFSADAMQLVFSFALGIAYGYVFQKTKSVLYPMIMHSVSNVFMVGAGYLIAAVF